MNLKKDLRRGVVACICLFTMLSGSIEAQFSDAVTLNYGYGINPVVSTVTGNDVQDIAGVRYEVMVSDNQSNSAIFGWKAGSNTGFLLLGNGNEVRYPDVAIIKNGVNQIFAIVVYYNEQTEEVWHRIYSWSSAQQTFNLSSQFMIAPGQVANTLQVASDDNGVYAITWDDQNEQIFMAFGIASGGAAPLLLHGGQAFPVSNGKQPDVAVFRKASTNQRHVHLTYIEPSGTILVDTYEWTDLINAVINPTLAFRSPEPDLMYQFPRIGCPASSYGTKDDFTVVTEDTDNNSTWYIKGFNTNTLSATGADLFIYNDGFSNYSPWNITSVPNRRPVVAYDDIGDVIWVSWNLDNSFGMLSSPGAPIGKLPVAICGTKRAGIHPGSNYLNVPYGLQFGNAADAISVSGHKSTGVLFTFNDQLASETFSKFIPHIANTPYLKAGGSQQSLQTWLENLMSDPVNYNRLIDINVYDLSGRKITSQRKELQAVSIEVEKIKREIATGVYVLRLETGDKQQIFSEKISAFNLN